MFSRCDSIVSEARKEFDRWTAALRPAPEPAPRPQLAAGPIHDAVTWLRAHVDDATGLDGVPEVHQFAGGASNLTYLLRTAEGRARTRAYYERYAAMARRAGLGFVLALLIVLGGLAFNIGNVAGAGLGLNVLVGVPVEWGAVVSAGQRSPSSWASLRLAGRRVSGSRMPERMLCRK